MVELLEFLSSDKNLEMLSEKSRSSPVTGDYVGADEGGGCAEGAGATVMPKRHRTPLSWL